MCDRATSSERCTTDKQIRCAGAPYTQRTWWKKRIEEETVVCMERMKEVHNIGKVNRLNLKLKIVTEKRNEAKRAKIHWIDSECVEWERERRKANVQTKPTNKRVSHNNTRATCFTDFNTWYVDGELCVVRAALVCVPICGFLEVFWRYLTAR